MQASSTNSDPYSESLGKMLQDLGARKHVGTNVHMYVLAKICGCHPGGRAGRETDIFVTGLEDLFSHNPLVSLAGSQGRSP